MSTSQHPIALRLEHHVGHGRGTKLLATVLALPLIDGIFPALIIAGAVDSLFGILEVGLLVFGGSATLSVILAEMDGTRREVIGSVLLVGSGVIIIAALEAALAPTITSLLTLHTFERFAALVILAIAAKTASATVGEYLPSPAVIIGLGLLASLDLSNVQLALATDPMLIAKSVAAAGVGVAFALVTALFGPTLRELVDLDHFRFGSAVALCVLALSILGFISGETPLALAVLGVTALLSIDLGESAAVPSDDSDDTTIADGGDADSDSRSEPDRATSSSSATSQSEHTSQPERAPWL